MHFEGTPLARQLAKCAAVAMAAMIAVTAFFGTTERASAQQGFGNFFGYQAKKPQRRRATRRHRHPSAEPRSAENEKKKKKDEKVATKPSGPVYVVISIGDQHINVYDATGRIARSPVSTGVRGRDTPQGVFSVIGKERHHYSNLYGSAPMPWMQRITWSGVAMHAGYVTGRPASHGCIRLPYSFAPRLWKMTKMGARVVVARKDTVPFAMSHDFLPLPTMRPPPEGSQQASTQAPRSPLELASMGSPAQLDIATSTKAGEPQPPAVLNPIAYAAELKEQAKADKKVATEAEKDALKAAQVAGAEARQAEADVHTGETDLRNAEAGLNAAEANLSEAKSELTTKEADLKAAIAKAAELSAQAVPLPVASDASAETTTKVETITFDAEKAAAEAEKASVSAKSALAAAQRKAEDAATARTAAKSELIRARAALEMAAARQAVKTPAAFHAVEVYKDAVAVQEAAAKTLREADRRLEPVSVFISKKEGRIFIRQDWKEVYEAPVTIRNPERPLGTHVYIAVGAEADGSAMQWSAISLPPEAPKAKGRDASKRLKRSKDTPTLPIAKTDDSGPESAKGALDRIEISPEARQHISALLWTGASLIVSDHARSDEMDNDTDFIVLTR